MAVIQLTASARKQANTLVQVYIDVLDEQTYQYRLSVLLQTSAMMIWRAQVVNLVQIMKT